MCVATNSNYCSLIGAKNPFVTQYGFTISQPHYKRRKCRLTKFKPVQISVGSDSSQLTNLVFFHAFPTWQYMIWMQSNLSSRRKVTKGLSPYYPKNSIYYIILAQKNKTKQENESKKQFSFLRSMSCSNFGTFFYSLYFEVNFWKVAHVQVGFGNC